MELPEGAAVFGERVLLLRECVDDVQLVSPAGDCLTAHPRQRRVTVPDSVDTVVFLEPDETVVFVRHMEDGVSFFYNEVLNLSLLLDDMSDELGGRADD